MQSKQTHKGVFQRFVMLFFVLMVVFQICPSPVLVAKAADAHTYYIQAAVDTSNWTIAAGVVNDKEAWFGNYTEVERIGSNNLKNLKADSPSNMLTGMLSSMPSSGGGSDKNNKVLSFPGFDTGPVIGFTPQASTTMQDRAMFVKDSIVFDLNTAINVVYGGKTWDSIDEFRASVVSILSAAENGGTVNGWSFTRSISTDATLRKKLTNEEQGVFPENYVMLLKGSEKYYLMTGIVKYLDSMSETDKPSNPSTDTQYITWGTIFYEALVNSTLEKDAVTSDAVYNSTVQGVLEGAVTDLFSALLNGLRSLLGLWDLDQLIFNRGARGSTGFVAGIFPSSWESFIWTFFLITEILSFAIIMAAIAKHIMQRAAATVNPAIRANLMEQIKDMAIGILFLILLPALIVGLMQISAALVEVFDKIVEDKSITESLSHFSTGNSIASIVVGFANLIINVYFNWFYIIREITVALLIVLSPIFVTWMCMGSEKKGMAMRWLIELLSNIFIQPIHALLFSFIILLPSTGRPIESLVMLYCLIPMTALLKGLFFPGVGEMGHRIAGGASMKANAMAKKAGMATIGAGIGAAKGGLDLARANREAKNGTASAGESNSSDNNIKQKHVNEGDGVSNKKPERRRLMDEANAGAGVVEQETNTSTSKATAFVGGTVGSDHGETSGGGTVSGGKKALADRTTDMDTNMKKVRADNQPNTKSSNLDDNSSLETSDMSATEADSFDNEINEGGVVEMKESGETSDDPSDGVSADSSIEKYAPKEETARENPNVKTRGGLAAFNEDLKKNLCSAKEMTDQDAVDRKVRQAEGPSMLSSAAKIVAGAAITGAVRGWKGQVFADHSNNTMTRNAHGDYLSASRGKFERAQAQAEEQSAADIQQRKQEGVIPSIPYRQVGNTNMTDKDDLSSAQSFKDDEGHRVFSYSVNENDLTPTDRESLEQIATDPETREAALKAGYEVDKISDSNGDYTGEYFVRIRDNKLAGTKAPSIQGRNIVHGGAYNDLIPDTGKINEMNSRYQEQKAEEERVYQNRENSFETLKTPTENLTSLSSVDKMGVQNITSDKNGLSYMIPKDALNVSDREMFEQAVTDSGIQHEFNSAGYAISDVKNADGSSTGMYQVKIKDNPCDGRTAPYIQGKNIVHGGTQRNDLMPNLDDIRVRNSDRQNYENYSAEMKKREAEIHAVETSVFDSGVSSLQTEQDRYDKTWRNYTSFVSHSSNGASPSKALSQSMGATSEGLITGEQMKEYGISNIVQRDDGTVSYNLDDNSTLASAVLVRESLSGNAGEENREKYAAQGYSFEKTDHGLTVTVSPPEGQKVFNNITESNGDNSYEVTDGCVPLLPDAIISEGETAKDVLYQDTKNRKNAIGEKIRSDYNQGIQSLNLPQKTHSIERGREYARKAGNKGNGRPIIHDNPEKAFVAYYAKQIAIAHDGDKSQQAHEEKGTNK